MRPLERDAVPKKQGCTHEITMDFPQQRTAIGLAKQMTQSELTISACNAPESIWYNRPPASTEDILPSR